jgi:hypothetical protein
LSVYEDLAVFVPDFADPPLPDFADPPLPDFLDLGVMVGFFEGFGVEVEL